MKECLADDLLDLQRSIIYKNRNESYEFCTLNKIKDILIILTYRPAAKRVPLALPNVDIVTLSGMSQVNGPNIRFPKVTATASESIISPGDIAVI